MKFFIKKILIISTLLSLFGFSLQDLVVAASEFEHLISANYIIKDDNSATVEYNFKTTNKLNDNYLKSYLFTLPFEPININTDKSPTPIKLNKIDRISNLNTYEIEIEFLNPVYGKEKSFDWGFSFDVKDLVIERGMQKAIIVPTFVKKDNFISYNISLKLSKKLGELSIIYGNAGIQENEDDYFLSFVSTRNQAPNIILLLNKTQEYSFEAKANDADAVIPLPLVNDKQKVIYSDFPEISESINNLKKNKNFILLKKNQNIKGTIKTTKGYDNQIFLEKDKIKLPNYDYLNEIANNVESDGLSNFDIAKKIYNDYLSRFTITNYTITKDIVLNLEEDKFNVNPIELNYIYRYLLDRFNISSRGVYGYVYPIQPFKIENPETYIHVWTEFWDGEKWISADPVWYLSSKGSSYFDNNYFHHVSFGYYYDFNELKPFLDVSKNIKVIPLKSSEYAKKESDINIELADKVYINRELQAKFVNKSNFPIFLKDVKLNIDTHDVKVVNQFEQINVVLYPNSTAFLNFILDYDLVLLNKYEDVSMEVTFFDNDDVKTKTIKSSIKIQSNLSIYLTVIIFVFFIVFSLVSLFFVSIYRRSSKNYSERS